MEGNGSGREMRTEINGGGSAAAGGAELKHVLQNPEAGAVVPAEEPENERLQPP